MIFHSKVQIMAENNLPKEIQRKKYTFKQWQIESRIKALIAIIKFLIIVLLCLGSFCLGRYF